MNGTSPTHVAVMRDSMGQQQEKERMALKARNARDLMTMEALGLPHESAQEMAARHALGDALQ